MNHHRFRCNNCWTSFEPENPVTATEGVRSEVPKAKLLEASCPLCGYTVKVIVNGVLDSERVHSDPVKQNYFYFRRGGLSYTEAWQRANQVAARN